jgi:hypothetical protein
MQYKKEWLGEVGYCNCLLVTMCRAHIHKIEIRTNVNVPDLELLATHRPDTVNWLRTQEFHYPSINARAVINLLSRSAEISRLPWGKKEGSINAYDVVGNDGPTVKRTFRVKKLRDREGTILKIEFDNIAEPNEK